MAFRSLNEVEMPEMLWLGSEGLVAVAQKLNLVKRGGAFISLQQAPELLLERELFFFKDFIYLFMKGTEKETE